MNNKLSTTQYRITQLANKANYFRVMILLATGFLLVRLIWLQVIQNHYYLNRAVANSTRVTFLRAPRGVIYDRHGNLLATNKQTLSLIAIPNELEHCDVLAEKVAKLIDEPEANIFNELLKIKASNSVLPVVLDRDINVDTVSRFYEQKLFLPGIDVL